MKLAPMCLVLPEKMRRSKVFVSSSRKPAERLRLEKEEQRNERTLTFEKSRSKRYEACSDVPNVPQIEAQRKRVRFGSEETPRPAKKPRRKAGLRAKRGVSELCHVNTMDQFPRWRHKPVTQRKRSQV